MVLQWLVWKKSFDNRVWLSLLPIVGGIVLTSVTELSFNMAGFLAAFFGCVVTSTKTILAESLLHGYKFDRFVCIQYAYTILHCIVRASEYETRYLHRIKRNLYCSRHCKGERRMLTTNINTQNALTSKKV